MSEESDPTEPSSPPPGPSAGRGGLGVPDRSGIRTRTGLPDVVIVGGGIIGMAAAHEMAGRGLSVTVLEAGEPGRQASAAAAGMLAPLAEIPTPGPMFEAARASRDLWQGFARQIAVDAGLPSSAAFGYDTRGAMAVATDEASAKTLDDLARAAADLGEDAEPMPVAEARRWVPDLTESLLGALHLPGDHRVDSPAFCRALLTATRHRGVQVQPHSPVLEITETGNGVTLRIGGPGAPHTVSAGAVVVAAGAWSGRLLREAFRNRDTEPDGATAAMAISPVTAVAPVRGQMISLGEVHWPWTGAVRAGDRYAVRPRSGVASSNARGSDSLENDTLLIGATVEPEAGFSAHNTAAGLMDLTAFLGRVFPGLLDRPVLSMWAGLRPGSPDGMPWIGRLPRSRHTWVATGHYRNGILLAPWTARRLADRLWGDGDSVSPETGHQDPFGLERCRD